MKLNDIKLQICLICEDIHKTSICPICKSTENFNYPLFGFIDINKYHIFLQVEHVAKLPIKKMMGEPNILGEYY